METLFYRASLQINGVKQTSKQAKKQKEKKRKLNYCNFPRLNSFQDDSRDNSLGNDVSRSLSVLAFILGAQPRVSRLTLKCNFVDNRIEQR